MSEKKKPVEKMTHLVIRCSHRDRARLKILADKYAKGNRSLWVRHGIWNAPREFLDAKKSLR